MIFNIIEHFGDLGFGNNGRVITTAYRQCRPFHKMIDNHEKGECKAIRLKDWDYQNPSIEILSRNTYVTFRNCCSKVGKRWSQSIELRVHGVEFICEYEFVKPVLLDISHKAELEYAALTAEFKDYDLIAGVRHGSNLWVHSIDYYIDYMSKARIRKSGVVIKNPCIITPYYQFRVHY